MSEAIFIIGLLITLIFIAITGFYPGGIIVPGFLVLFIDQPLRLVGTYVVAILTFLIFRLARQYLILYGKRRFVFILMTGALLTYLLSAVLPNIFSGSIEFRVIGWIIPGLIASHFDRQGVGITTGSMALMTALLFGLKRGILAIIIALGISTGPPDHYSAQAHQAALIMEEAIHVISKYCAEEGINQDRVNDPMKTGLIGPEYTGMTTTLGQLDAKRSSLNPNFGAVITTMMEEAGMHRGDTIGIGSSGSFPALMIASLSAAQAMGVEVRMLLSLGSSSFGACNPRFTILDIYQLLIDRDILKPVPTAVSLGGEKDIGEDYEEPIRALLLQKIKDGNHPFIHQSDLASNVKERMAFLENRHPGSIRLFISSGGSYSNLGTSSEILNLPPGLVRKAKLPEKEARGMIHTLLGMKIPVIHLLYMKGLTEQWQLMWDPVILPSVQ